MSSYYISDGIKWFSEESRLDELTNNAQNTAPDLGPQDATFVYTGATSGPDDLDYFTFTSDVSGILSVALYTDGSTFKRSNTEIRLGDASSGTKATPYEPLQLSVTQGKKYTFVVLNYDQYQSSEYYAWRFSFSGTSEPDKSAACDNGWNNYLYSGTATLNAAVTDSAGIVLNTDMAGIQLDEKGSVDYRGWSNYVGSGATADESDFVKIVLETSASLSFTISSADAAKFTVWDLIEGKDKKGNVVYSQKSLQATTVKKVKGNAGNTVQTKSLLLNAGEYYVSMQSTNVKKGGGAFYNVSLNQEQSIFYTEGDNSDNWTDLATAGDASSEYAFLNAPIKEGEVLLENWVGFGDAVDYAQLHLDSAAKLSFALNATDAAKFSIFRLGSKTDKKGVTTYTLTSLQSTPLKKPKNAEEYSTTTKGLLMEAGDYYIAMESPNAQKGKNGSAYYSIALGTGTFFDSGDGGWNNYVYDKKADEQLNPNISGFMSTDITSSTGEVLLDMSAGSEEWNNFVGFGDAVDYAKIMLSSAAKLSFTITATDAAKFTVCQLIEGTGRKAGTYTLKQLQTTTLKKAKGTTEYSANTKALTLSEGVYFISMQSTNAKNGGAAFYNVMVNQDLSSGLPDADLDLPETSQNMAALVLPSQDDPLAGGTAGASVMAAVFDSALDSLFEGIEKGMLASL